MRYHDDRFAGALTAYATNFNNFIAPLPTGAIIEGVGPAPRIPPLRVRGGITFDADRFAANVEAVHSTRQNRLAANKSPVGEFTLVNASMTWRPRGKEGALALILSGDNLLDEVGRLTSSETREFVPISGRNARLTFTLKI